MSETLPDKYKATLIDPANLHTYYEKGEYVTVDVTSGIVVGGTGVGQVLNKFVLRPELAHHICNLLSEGKTIKDILCIEGMPDRATYNKWRRHSPDFDDMVKAALEDRADVMFDKIMDLADEAKLADKEAVAGLKLAADLYKWGAEVGNRKRYSPKELKGSGDGVGNVVIQIDTGSKDLDNMKVKISDNGELEGFDIVDTEFEEVVDENA